MTISVSVISHAFITEKGAPRAISTCSLYPYGGVLHNLSEQPADMKIDNIVCECMQSQDMPYSVASSQMQTAGSCACREFLLSPRSAMAASPSPRTMIGASPSPRLMAAAIPSPRAGSGSGKPQGKKKGHKKRGGRKRAPDAVSESKEPRSLQIAAPGTETTSREGGQLGACTCYGNRGFGEDGGLRPVGDICRGDGGGSGLSNVSVGLHHVEMDVTVPELRDECSSALGIAKEDLELFGLCHIPSSAERVSLLKDKSGTVHLGVMVRNSDLNLQNIEELVIHKDKAEHEVESYRIQINKKSQDFDNLKLKYEKLTEEVLRLRTMVNRANHLRRESEKATEVLRVEFEKLVKTLFMECSSQSLDKAEPVNG